MKTKNAILLALFSAAAVVSSIGLVAVYYRKDTETTSSRRGGYTGRRVRRMTAEEEYKMLMDKKMRGETLTVEEQARLDILRSEVAGME